MKAVILAGGKGTRMQSEAAAVPKCLLPVGDKPVVNYAIECCIASEYVTEIIIVLSHEADMFESYFKEHEFNIPMTLVTEKSPLGTAGALHSIKTSLDDTFLVLYADIVCWLDCKKLIEFHKLKKSTATLVVHPNDHPFDSDIVEADSESKILKVHSKPHRSDKFLPNCVSAAFYVLEPNVINYIPENKPTDFGKDIFPNLVQKQLCYAYATPEYLKDMGTPDRYNQVKKDILEDKLTRYHLSKKRPAVFLDRDGVINIERSFIKTPKEFELYSNTAQAIKLLNKAGFLVIVVTNQSAIARNLVTEKGLQEIHWKMETLLGKEGAFVDKIYYCPHHPDKGFPEENKALKIECECRKPNPGMLKQAQLDFNIEMSNSFLVGDSERDILAGLAAGVHTIGVKTGNSVVGKTNPHKMAESVLDAAEYIVNFKT